MVFLDFAKHGYYFNRRSWAAMLFMLILISNHWLKAQCGSINKGNPFESDYPNTTGVITDCDRVEKDKILTYEISPPIEVLNSGYGSTWLFNGFSVKTLKGINLSTRYYSIALPTSSTNAKITFIPDIALVDSTLVIFITVNALSPACSSTLKRYIIVGKGSVSAPKNNMEEFSDITLFPNPCSGLFSVNIKKPEPDLCIAIFDQLGRRMEHIFGLTATLSNQHLFYLPKGVYLVEIINSGHVYHRKIMVQ